MPTADDIRVQLQAKGAWRNCPACDHPEWSVGSEFALYQVVAQDYTMKTLGRGYPVVILICDNCGFTRSHNLITLGYPAPPPPPPPAPVQEAGGNAESVGNAVGSEQGEGGPDQSVGGGGTQAQ